MNPFPLTLAILLSVSYASTNDLTIFTRWAIIIMISFVIAPIVYVYTKKALADNTVNSFQDPTAFFRVHRSQIWISGIISAILFIPLLVLFHAPPSLTATFAALMGTSLLLTLTNKYYKASFHLAIVTACVIVAVLTWGKAVLPVLIAIPFVGWARYILNEHSPYQLASGFGLALIITAISFYYFGLLGKVII